MQGYFIRGFSVKKLNTDSNITLLRRDFALRRCRQVELSVPPHEASESLENLRRRQMIQCTALRDWLSHSVSNYIKACYLLVAWWMRSGLHMNDWQLYEGKLLHTCQEQRCPTFSGQPSCLTRTPVRSSVFENVI